MKLNVIDNPSNELHLSLGVSDERSNELCQQMDTICNAFYMGKAEIILSDVLAAIAEICNTPEELVWCCITHMSWLAHKGYLKFDFKPKPVA